MCYFIHIAVQILRIRKSCFVFELTHDIMNTICIVDYMVISLMVGSVADCLRVIGPACELVQKCGVTARLANRC